MRELLLLWTVASVPARCLHSRDDNGHAVIPPLAARETCAETAQNNSRIKWKAENKIIFRAHKVWSCAVCGDVRFFFVNVCVCNVIAYCSCLCGTT